jgi:hypothetical protein
VPATLGAPDSVTVSGTVLASQFNQTVTYTTLAAALGLAEGQLLGYELIAWEANGGSPAPAGGFESSSWMFQTALGGISTMFNGVDSSSLNPDVGLQTGSISGAAYNALFGTSVPAQSVWSYLLVNLPAYLGVDGPGRGRAGLAPTPRRAHTDPALWLGRQPQRHLHCLCWTACT